MPLVHVPNPRTGRAIALPPDGAKPTLIVDFLRAGFPAHLDDQLSVNAIPLAHRGALASWGRNHRQPSSLFLRFTSAGGYRITGTRRGMVVFEQDVAVHATGSRTAVPLD